MSRKPRLPTEPDLFTALSAPAAPDDTQETMPEFESSPLITPDAAPDEGTAETLIQEPRLWCDRGWTARVIKNEEDEGWAVAMIKDGEAEPALVGPWTMGRDKKNPKPLDVNAFNTLVKTASEVIRRHEQQLHAMLHRQVDVEHEGMEIRVTLDIVPDEEHPYADLAAFDPNQVQLAKVRVSAGFKLNAKTALQWVENDFRRPE